MTQTDGTAQDTRRLGADKGSVATAARLLGAGRLVAFPTETVYGLGADARNDRAVAAIFQAKNRPAFNPLIVHLPNLDAARAIADFPDRAARLAETFWPGPLTLVLPLRPDSGLSALVTAGLDTVAIRVPEHPLARALLSTFAGPVAAPSANPSGRISPTRPEHVLSGLSGRIAAVLDGGPCPVGLESTIVGFTPDPTLLRPGGLPAEIIAQCLGTPLASPPPGTTNPSAPGQLASHYAPGARVRLNATERRKGEAFLGFGPIPGDINLSPAGDLVEAAANLFHALRALDDTGAETIAVAPIPDTGLGAAINDRLRRAAAPRN